MRTSRSCSVKHRGELALAPFDEDRAAVRAMCTEVDRIHRDQKRLDFFARQAIARAYDRVTCCARKQTLDPLVHRRRLSDVFELVEQIDHQRFEIGATDRDRPRLDDEGATTEVLDFD